MDCRLSDGSGGGREAKTAPARPSILPEGKGDIVDFH
jgi:hypothetical protein